MEAVSTVQELAEKGYRRVVLACGVFDGVHRGHQCVLQELCATAARQHATPIALTFNPHPRSILNRAPPGALTTSWQKNCLLQEHGAGRVVMIHFSHQIAELDAVDFVHRHLLDSALDVAGICVGESWRFGRNGQGDVELLRQIGERRGFEVMAVPELTWYRKPISSTRIRNAVREGRLDRARRMLGRPYRVCGHVIHGKGIGSRHLNCPTANLADPMILLPPPGVYAARSILYSDDRPPHPPHPLHGIVYVGSAPTFGDEHNRGIGPSLELHLFDFHRDLYGTRIEVEFRGLIRKERVFEDKHELEKQIQHDIETAREQMYPNE